MPIRVKCESCKKTLSVKDHLAGKKIKCPVCQCVLSVPTVAALKPAAAPGAKKPAPVAKPAVKGKPAIGKPEGNGASPSAQNPPVTDPPPENVEAEALAAFADEPPPPEDTAPPEFIEFKCQWCDEQVKLPLELAGKQGQCPNEECRRIIKVPLPKPSEKKDWRKMDKKGPSAAILNQPEQLENAWGTEEASKARQASLVQAGVIDLPVKTRPRDFLDRVVSAAKLVMVIALVGGAGFGIWNLISAKQQQGSIKDLEQLLKGSKGVGPKIASGTLLAADAHRTLGLMYLRSDVKNPAIKAQKALQGAALFGFTVSEQNPAINEQLFLIDVALAQIELGGDAADLVGATKLSWEDTRSEIEATLTRIKNPDILVMALREVGSRLFEKGQGELAIGLTVKPAAADGQGRRSPAYRQQIALIFAKGEPESLKKIPAEKNLKDANVRVGYAEGYARKGDYGKAEEEFVKAPGAAKDRLDASLGVAAVAMQDAKNKDQAGKFVKLAMNIVREKDANTSDWQLLQLVRLAAHTEEADVVKDLVKGLRQPAFKLRAELEIFLNQCERTTGRMDADKLAGLEALDVQTKGAKLDASVGTTLAVAWTAFARQTNNLSAAHKALTDRAAGGELPTEIVERIRPMIDIGSYQAALK